MPKKFNSVFSQNKNVYLSQLNRSFFAPWDVMRVIPIWQVSIFMSAIYNLSGVAFMIRTKLVMLVQIGMTRPLQQYTYTRIGNYVFQGSV